MSSAQPTRYKYLPARDRGRFPPSTLVLALSAALALPGAAWANDWTGTVDNDWFTAGNWTNPAAVPTAADNTTIESGGLVFVNGLVGANAAANDLIAGNTSAGTLAITNGATLTSMTGSLGESATGSGTVLVNGATSVWNVNNILLVGNSGTGTLNISGGGKVSNTAGVVQIGANGNGTATVDGTGSSWKTGNLLLVGNGGVGTLNITGEGAVQSVDARIGDFTGGTGTVNVAGPVSSWALTGGLTVARLGTGTLAITGGGTVSDNTAVLGSQAGSTGMVTVDGAGSSWSNAGGFAVGLTVGDGGNGTLAITNGGAASAGGVAMGIQAGSTGTVMVDGNGSSFTSNGPLSVGSSGTATLTIANAGTVAADNFFLATLMGSAGTLNIGGAAGAAAAAPGTLVTPDVHFGDGAGVINFNHTDTSGNYVFSANIDGAAGTINQNAGWTQLTGNSAAFTGTANVNGGRLAVNGSLAGATVNVNNGGTLGGNGTVGNTAVNAGGIVAPGNSIGTLNVNGNVSFAAGSIYQVETNPAGQSDKLLVSGTATLSGGTVQVIGGTGTYNPATSYSILTAQGGVTGTFAGVTSDLAFLTPTLSYAAKDVSLTLLRNDIGFANVGQTPNQKAAGTGAQGLGIGNAISTAMLSLSAPQARAAFDQLSGEVHASARGVQVQDSHFTRDASLDRLRALDSEAVANDGGADAEEGKSARLLPSVRDLAYWARAMGSWGHTDGDGNAATVKRDTSGFLMGADTRFGEEGRFGLMGGYSRSAFDVTDRNSSGSSDNYHLGAYAGSRWGDLALRTGISYSWHDVSTSRSVAFPGFTDSLKADYKASTTQAFAELGYRIKTEGADYEPFVNLANVNVSSDGFTERGGAAALSSAGNSSGVTFATVGLRASTSFDMDNGTRVTARGSLGWRGASGDVTPSTSLAFAGGSPFAVAGAPVAKNAAVVEAGFDFKLTNAATLGISYGGQFGSGLKDHSARIHLNVAF